MAFKMFQNKYERVLDTVFVYWESLWKFSARNKALNDDKICTKLTHGNQTRNVKSTKKTGEMGKYYIKKHT